MELVYLWVEEYKNIKRQGFNFSPRFKCEYNLEKNELSIDENKEYKSLFSKNINITAIVGENGTGKSSICGELYSVIKQYELKAFEYYMTHSISILKDKKSTLKQKRQQLSFIEKYFKTKKITFEAKKKITEMNENEIDNLISEKEDFILNNCKDLKETFTHNKLKFIYLFNSNNNLKCVTNISFYTNKKFDKYETFYEFSRQNKIGIFCALGEFSTRENHKGGEFVDSIYSILPLQRKELISADQKDVEYILDKIASNLNTVDINQKRQNKVIFNKDTPLTQLSFGEKYRIILFIQILNRLNKLNLYKETVVFLDEVTLSLHPNWQKKFIHEIISLFKGYSVHFIISSHSPFILSDLPKENVIFLSKYQKDEEEVKKGNQKVGNCKKLNDLFKIEQTFGANIHTLLSHGFFMKDGLMGEFAKEKINEVIKYLNPKNKEQTEIKTDKEAKNIIDIIGEPILKNTLLNMYEEKVYKNESKLDKLQRKKQDLENEIEELKKQKDKSNEES